MRQERGERHCETAFSLAKDMWVASCQPMSTSLIILLFDSCNDYNLFQYLYFIQYDPKLLAELKNSSRKFLQRGSQNKRAKECFPIDFYINRKTRGGALVAIK